MVSWVLLWLLAVTVAAASQTHVGAAIPAALPWAKPQPGELWATPSASQDDDIAVRDAWLIIQAAQAEAHRIERSAMLAAKEASTCACQAKAHNAGDTGVLCPQRCSGHGHCDKGCKCDDGWGGWGCYTRIPQHERRKWPQELVTLLITPSSQQCGGEQVRLARRYLPSVSIVYVDSRPPETDAEVQHVFVAPSSALGAKLNAGLAAIDATQSPFVIVLGSTGTVSRFTDIAALVDIFHTTDVDIVGATLEFAHADKVYDTCFQLNLANYTTSYAWGYTRSMRGCMICDRVSHVFAARVASLQDGAIQKGHLGPFDAALTGEAAFEDLWIRGKRNLQPVVFGHCRQLQLALVDACVDTSKSPQALEATYHPLGVKWGISNFQRPLIPSLHSPLPSSVQVCGTGGAASGTNGLLNNACLQSGMLRMLLLVSNWLEALGVPHVLSGQAHLGAIRFRDLLPWQRRLEIDAFGSAAHLASLVDSGIAALAEQSHLYVRVDRAAHSPQVPFPGVVFTVHDVSARKLTLDLSFFRTDADGSFVTLRGVALPPPSLEAVKALPLWAAGVVAVPPSGLVLRQDAGAHGSVAAAHPYLPRALIAVGGHRLPVRRFGEAFLRSRFGLGWALNVVNDPTATEGQPMPLEEARMRATTHSDATCPGAAKLSPGCLSAWEWHADRTNFDAPGEYKWPSSPADRGVVVNLR